MNWTPIATRLTVAALALCAGASATADEGLRLSGFATLAIGKALSGDSTTAFPQQECPCFVADWSHGAVYGPRAQIKQESRIGVQADYALTSALSATAQVVARGSDGINAQLEWAFLNYKISPQWQVQVGRKRLPLYYYSDFQDVGYAYTWARVPQDVYGWELVNYNGANLAYNGDWGSWSVRSNVYTGTETTRDNLLARMYDAPNKHDIKWSSMAGADIELARDWLTLRFNYNRMQLSDITRDTDTQNVPADGRRQVAYGAAANIDAGGWLVRTEAGVFDRHRYSYKARFYLLGLGYTFGKFTPMLTTSSYSETYGDPASQPDAQKWSTLTATLRYELRSSMALKLQYDKVRNQSLLIYNGNAKVLTATLDTVF